MATEVATLVTWDKAFQVSAAAPGQSSRKTDTLSEETIGGKVRSATRNIKDSVERRSGEGGNPRLGHAELEGGCSAMFTAAALIPEAPLAATSLKTTSSCWSKSLSLHHSRRKKEARQRQESHLEGYSQKLDALHPTGQRGVTQPHRPANEAGNMTCGPDAQVSR